MEHNHSITPTKMFVYNVYLLYKQDDRCDSQINAPKALISMLMKIESLKQLKKVTERRTDISTP